MGVEELLGELREEKGCEKGSPIPHAGQALGQLEGEGHTDAAELEVEIASHLPIRNRADHCQAAKRPGRTCAGATATSHLTTRPSAEQSAAFPPLGAAFSP